MRKKTIVFFVLNIYKSGGIERVVTEISNRLCNNYDIIILSMFKTDEKPYFELNSSIKHQFIFNKEFNLRYKYLYVRKAIKNVMKNIKCDYFVNCGMGYVPFTIFARKKSVYISWEHSNCLIGKKFGLTWLGRVLSNRFADAIVFLTKRDLKNFVKKFNKNRESKKYYHIYNPSFLKNPSKKYDFDSNKIISCGRLSYQKGYDYLIKVAKIVFSDPCSKGWSWDIFGDGELRDDISKEISKENLEKHLYLKGNVNNVGELYRDYSFFVLTSRFEGFCMVNIEASSNLLPIVSFDCNCGPDEIIIDGKNGYLIPCFNIELMADRIIELIKDKQKRIEFSNNTSIDKEKLSVDFIIQQWNSMLNELGDKK